MTKHDDLIAVRHMLDATTEAVKIVAGAQRSHLQPFDKDTLALTRLLEIIGEAARRTSQTFREQHPEIEWRAIAGTRDRLIHGYDAVDYDILWDICTSDLPRLADKLKAIITISGSNR